MTGEPLREGEARSSASVKDSTRGYDLDVKSYDDGHLAGALDEAIREYARGKRLLRELHANDWQDTVEMVRQAKEAAA